MKQNNTICNDLDFSSVFGCSICSIMNQKQKHHVEVVIVRKVRPQTMIVTHNTFLAVTLCTKLWWSKYLSSGFEYWMGSLICNASIRAVRIFGMSASIRSFCREKPIFSFFKPFLFVSHWNNFFLTFTNWNRVFSSRISSLEEQIYMMWEKIIQNKD